MSQKKPPKFIQAFNRITNEVDRDLAILISRRDATVKKATTQEQKDEAQRQIRRDVSRLYVPASQRILTIVRPHAAKRDSVSALIWIVERADENTRDEAAHLLTRHHAVHPDVIALAASYCYAPRPWTEKLVRAQLESKALKEADRPRVLLTLAIAKQSLSQLPRILEELSPKEFDETRQEYGARTVGLLRALSSAREEAEARSLYRELAVRYSTRIVSGAQTFGALAKTALFEMENLAVGKTAPEIVGEGLDGMPLTLSEHRGKIVVLTFWATWCAPCMAMVPHERDLVRRMKGRPFELIGVNGDTDRAKALEAVKREKMSWRSFWSGSKGPEGELPASWNVRAWPTVYVIDATGTIRAKNYTGPALDRLADQLVRALEKTL